MARAVITLIVEHEDPDTAQEILEAIWEYGVDEPTRRGLSDYTLDFKEEK